MNKIIILIATILLFGSIAFFYTDYSTKLKTAPVPSPMPTLAATTAPQASMESKSNTIVVKLNADRSRSDLYSPTEVKTDATATSISLTWKFGDKKINMSDKELAPYITHSGFRIYRDGAWYTDTLGNLNTFTDTNLYPGESYTYSVAALTFDNKIEGIMSESVKSETKTEELKPTIAKKDSYQVYVASGDSITEGLRAAKGKGWVDQFTAYLKKTNPQLKTVIAAKTGVTTMDLEKTIGQDIEGSKPDLVTIGIGINDVIAGVDTGSGGFKMLDVKNRLEKIIDITSPSPERTVLLLNIYYQNCCEVDWAKSGKDLAWNKMIKDLAYAKKIQLIDVYSPMKAAGAEKVLSVDKLHPSQEGHDIIAETVIKTFGSPNEKTNGKQ